MNGGDVASSASREPEVANILNQTDQAVQELAVALDNHEKRIDAIVTSKPEGKSDLNAVLPGSMTKHGTRLRQNLNMIRGITARMTRLTSSVEL